jgi:4-hydroxy-2-oxoheptanedioate aldolase
MRPNAAKKLLREGKPAVGTWLSLGSLTAARFMARAGFSWLTVDTEHTATGTETAAAMFAAIADAGCVALARVLANRHDHIKRALDTGAMGVVVPMVNSRAEAEAAVSACKYPPRGTRSVGGGVHALNFAASAADYFARADDELLVVLQCEHIEAVEHADEIFSVPGIDAIFVGPNDLAASMRNSDGTGPTGDATAKAMARILAACRKHKVAAGVHCFSTAEAQRRIAEGWQFIAVNSELRMMLDGAAAVLGPLIGEESGTMLKY